MPFLDARYPGACRVVVTDNGSTDRTFEIAEGLSARWPQVLCLRIPGKGRGRPLRAAWLVFDARAVAYMDVDLSTDLEAFPEVPVIWVEGQDSRVWIARTAWEDIKGLLRVRFTRGGGNARPCDPRDSAPVVGQ